MFTFLNKQSKQTQKSEIHDITGCCGKMPMHGDFIKHNLRVREAVALDEWVQDGVTLLNRRYDQKWKNVFRLSPNFRFSFVGAEDGKTITGVIAPSRDASGRDYPFTAFRAMDDKVFREQQSLIPLVMHQTFSDLDELLEEDNKEHSVSSFSATVDRIMGSYDGARNEELLEQIERILDNTTIDQIWDDILPGADEKIRVAFLYVIVNSLHTVARRTPNRVHWGLRIPLPSGYSSIKHIIFWMKLTETILKERNLRSHIMWNAPAPGIPSRLLLFFHPIPASYFNLLIDQRRVDDTVVDVLQEIENFNAESLEVSKYYYPGDMSLREILDEVINEEVIA